MDHQNHQFVDPPTDADIYAAARSGTLVQRFDPLPPECLSFKTPRKNNILHIACRHNHIKIIKHARRVANDPDHPQQRAFAALLLEGNFIDETPFHTAVRYGHTDIVKKLCKYFNYRPPQQDVEGGDAIQRPWRISSLNEEDTVLHVAIRNGYQDIADYLLKADPELVTFVNEAGESPLYLAAENRCCDILKIIMNPNSGCSVDGPNDRNPLHAAVKAGSEAACEFLIKNRPDFIKKPDMKGKTPLHLAVEYKQKKLIKMLLDKDKEGEALSVYDNEGFTPLLRAATKGHLCIITKIIARFPDIATMCSKTNDETNKKNIIHHLQNMTPCCLRIFLRLKTIKSMINHQDTDGNTPLHLSIIKGDKDKAIVLLEVQETNWRIKNNSNQTPMDLLKTLQRRSPTTPQQEEPTSEQALITRAASTKMQDPTSKGEVMTSVQMRLIRHAIEIRESVLHPHVLKSSWGPTYKRINIQEETLAYRKPEDLKRIMDGITLVATLIVTLTFAAAFQVPGGYNEETGSIILISRKSLKVFFYSDTIAMLLCILIMLDYAWAFTTVRPSDLGYKVFRQTLTLSISLTFTIIAFISGLYAVVPNTDHWLMHTISLVTLLVMTALVVLHPINLLFLRFPINLSFLGLPIIFMGPLTCVGIAAFKDFRAQKALLSKHSSKKHD